MIKEQLRFYPLGASTEWSLDPYLKSSSQDSFMLHRRPAQLVQCVQSTLDFQCPEKLRVKKFDKRSRHLLSA